MWKIIPLSKKNHDQDSENLGWIQDPMKKNVLNNSFVSKNFVEFVSKNLVKNFVKRGGLFQRALFPRC